MYNNVATRIRLYRASFCTYFVRKSILIIQVQIIDEKTECLSCLTYICTYIRWELGPRGENSKKVFMKIIKLKYAPAVDLNK